jgi:hypothetical protein
MAKTGHVASLRFSFANDRDDERYGDFHQLSAFRASFTVEVPP